MVSSEVTTLLISPKPLIWRDSQQPLARLIEPLFGQVTFSYPFPDSLVLCLPEPPIVSYLVKQPCDKPPPLKLLDVLVKDNLHLVHQISLQACVLNTLVATMVC